MGQNHSRSHELVLRSAAGDVETVRTLLEQYILQQRRLARGDSVAIPPNELVDINHALPEGDFALEMAVTHQHVMVVRLLIEHGCNIDQQDSSGLTALMCACHEADSTLTRILLKHGHASVDLRDGSGWTALHFAAYHHSLESLELLIEHKATLDITNNQGETALFLAAANQHHDIAKALLEHGSDPFKANFTNQKPFDFLPTDLRQLFDTNGIMSRADTMVASLYPFLTGGIVETVMEYDDGCYDRGKSVALRRIMLYLQKADDEADRLAAERRRSLYALQTSPLSGMSSSSSSSLAAPSRASPSAVSNLSLSASPQPTPNPPSNNNNINFPHTLNPARQKILTVARGNLNATTTSTLPSTATLSELDSAISSVHGHHRRTVDADSNDEPAGGSTVRGASGGVGQKSRLLEMIPIVPSSSSHHHMAHTSSYPGTRRTSEELDAEQMAHGLQHASDDYEEQRRYEDDGEIEEEEINLM